MRLSPTTPIKVGVLVLGSLGSVFTYFTVIRETGLKKKDTYVVSAVFEDVSGLVQKSRVQTAGIPVGQIEDIKLEGGRARIFLRIKKEMILKTDATISKRAESILGDYLLDLQPGSDGASALGQGGEITRVYAAPGVEQIFESLSRITVDIQDVTTTLRDVLGGEEGIGSLRKIVESMTQVTASVNKTILDSGEKLNGILANFETFSEDVRGLTAGKGEEFGQIVTNAKAITEDTRAVLASIKQIIGTGEGELKESVAGLRSALDKLDTSLRSLQDITGKVQRGEGTLGKLVNDERIAVNLDRTLADAGDFVGRVVRLQTEVTLRSDFLFHDGAALNRVGLRVSPRPDKYYLFELVDDPRGIIEEERAPGPGGRAVTTRVWKQKWRFSAMFGKRYGPVGLRLGLLDGSGGGGADLHLMDDTLRVSADVFRFTPEDNVVSFPRLRAYLQYVFLGHLFLTAGVDDALNRNRIFGVREVNDFGMPFGRSFFAGAGLFFTDEDLKAILTALPAPSFQ